MSIKKTGDWAKAEAFFKDLENNGKVAASKLLKQIGLKGEQIAVEHLQKQDLGWKELSARYKMQKMKATANYSEKILIRTSTLFQSITTFTANKKAYVGVKKGVKYQNSKGEVEVANIMAIHEFGSDKKGIPARPLFKPTREELKAFCTNNPKLANAFLSEIGNLEIDNKL